LVVDPLLADLRVGHALARDLDRDRPGGVRARRDFERRARDRLVRLRREDAHVAGRDRLERLVRPYLVSAGGRRRPALRRALAARRAPVLRRARAVFAARDRVILRRVSAAEERAVERAARRLRLRARRVAVLQSWADGGGGVAVGR